MVHEKIVKLDNGTEIKVEVSVYVELFRNEFYYRHCVTTRLKGKRKFLNVSDTQRKVLETFGLNTFIETAKTELWQKLKP